MCREIQKVEERIQKVEGIQKVKAEEIVQRRSIVTRSNKLEGNA